MALLNYIFIILLISALAFILWRLEYDGLLKRVFFPALVFKLICGILLAIFYQKYFGGADMSGYQSMGDILTKYFTDSPVSYLRLWFTGKYESETIRAQMPYYWHSNTHFMALLVSITNIFTSTNFYLNTLLFSFFSFFGCWQLVTTLATYFPDWKRAAIFCFLFLPSAIFWSASISKEAIYTGSLCWFLALVLKLSKSDFKVSAFKNILYLLLATYILWKIKYFFAVAVFTLMALYFFYKISGKKQVLGGFVKACFAFSIVLVAVIVLAIPLFHVLNLDYFIYELMRNYKVLSLLSTGKPSLIYPFLEPSITSVLLHSPLAFFNATFRPFIWESPTIIYLIAGIENFVWLLLATISFLSLFFFKPKNIDAFLVILLIYCFMVGAIIGLTTPNLGTLSRYKTAFLPFFIFVCLRTPFFARYLRFPNSVNPKL